jgi:thymidylate synthase (FAD)
MAVELKWATPDIDAMIGHMARVSNPKALPGDPAEKLIKYLIDHKHWSPLEMASVCVEIETTRDIARQILRHRSLHFQEFSQRYAEVTLEFVSREARLQDPKNRQNSIITEDSDLQKEWEKLQAEVYFGAMSRYQYALSQGIAKEQARALLPEGLTQTRMYVSGTVRDWYHYLAVRLGPETQYEHRVVAQEILKVLQEVAPTIFSKELFSA